MINRTNIVFKLFCFGIRCKQSQTFMDLKWTCLIMESRRSSCCSLLIKHDSWGIRDTSDWHKDPILPYASWWRIVTSVWHAVFWRVKYKLFNSGSYYFGIGCVFCFLLIHYWIKSVQFAVKLGSHIDYN